VYKTITNYAHSTFDVHWKVAACAWGNNNDWKNNLCWLWVIKM